MQSNNSVTNSPEKEEPKTLKNSSKTLPNKELRQLMNCARKELETFNDEFRKCQERYNELDPEVAADKCIKELDVSRTIAEKEKKNRLRQIASLKNRIDQLAEENEEIRKKTLQFATNFVKEEYKANLKKAMRSQEAEFLAVDGYNLVKILEVVNCFICFVYERG